MHSRDLRLLLHFFHIARAGSIRGAAEALAVSPPVVSQALRELEDLVGVTLIRRTTRRLDLTDAGRQVLAGAEAMVAHAGSSMSVGDANKPVVGHLRITAPVELADAWLPPRLAEYRALYPAVTLSVDADDAPLDFAKTSADLAVRTTFCETDDEAAALDPHMVLPVELVAAPQLIVPGRDVAARLRGTGFLQAEDRPVSELPARDPTGARVVFEAPVMGSARDRRTLHAMALEALGAVLLIRDTVAEDLEAGRLVRLAPDHVFGVVAVRLMPVDPQPAASVRAFLALAQDFSHRTG